MVVATALAALTLLCLALARVGPVRRTPPHPESLTAVLGPGDEEYLAWLAAEHWPDDEYLDLERSWRACDGEDTAD